MKGSKGQVACFKKTNKGFFCLETPQNPPGHKDAALESPNALSPITRYALRVSSGMGRPFCTIRFGRPLKSTMASVALSIPRCW
jgi:hypothetical protein